MCVYCVHTEKVSMAKYVTRAFTVLFNFTVGLKFFKKEQNYSESPFYFFISLKFTKNFFK